MHLFSDLFTGGKGRAVPDTITLNASRDAGMHQRDSQLHFSAACLTTPWELVLMQPLRKALTHAHSAGQGRRG